MRRRALAGSGGLWRTLAGSSSGELWRDKKTHRRLIAQERRISYPAPSISATCPSTAQIRPHHSSHCPDPTSPRLLLPRPDPTTAPIAQTRLHHGSQCPDPTHHGSHCPDPTPLRLPLPRPDPTTAQTLPLPRPDPTTAQTLPLSRPDVTTASISHTRLQHCSNRCDSDNTHPPCGTGAFPSTGPTILLCILCFRTEVTR